MKSKFWAVIALAAFFTSILLAAGSSLASPSTSPVIAPINPEFIAWQNKTANLNLGLSDAQGHSLGEIPSPIDRSHLLNQGRVLASPLDGLPASYDLRTFGYVTPVKDQGGCGSCWAFATYGSLESWLLKNASETWDFSENHLKNYHGFDWTPCYGGNADMSTAYLTRWSGPVSEADDPYHDYDDRPSPGGAQQKILEKVLWFFTAEDIKNAIMTYGGMYVTLRWESSYYNDSQYTYYYSGSDANNNHGVTVIGWDDNKVVTGAPGNGAWLVKNSWGASWGDGGYFWISYYDNDAVKYAVAFCDAVPTSSYTVIHQYDPLGMTTAAGSGSTTAWAANIFNTSVSEKLKAVGLYAVTDNVSYEIGVCDDFDGSSFSNVLGSVEGTLAHSGYYTIPLPSPISFAPGEDFAIVVEFTSPGYNWPIPVETDIAGYSSGASAYPGESYVSENGAYFTDITEYIGFENTNVCIRGLSETCPLPEKAGNPNPENLATGIGITTMLSWTPGPGATSHDIYFGTAFPLPLVGSQPGTTFNPGTLNYCAYYFWRIDERNACGVTTGDIWSFETIPAAPGQATNPSPADSETDVSIDKKLSWTAGNSSTSHDVYFGTVSPPPFVGNQPGTTFNPGTLNYTTTYYWRIDEKNPCATTAGEEWKFVTSKLKGVIIGWGDNTYGQSGIPILYEFYAVSGGYYHSLGLLQGGTVFGIGRNDYGQCDAPAPNADFNAIAAGGRHSIGLKLDGSIVAWGHNGYGQCDVPVPNTDFVAIAAGYSHSLGLKADGSIVAWGRNDHGQCNVPLPNSGFIAVAAGSYHSLGLKWNGQIVAWGYNAYGQCDVPIPNSGFKAIDGGAYHSLGLKQNDSVFAWGDNGLGQCTVPTPNTDFKAISAGAYHSMGLKSTGNIVAWGYNASGQCTVPAPNSNFKKISAGGEHSLAIKPLSINEYDGNVDYNTVYQQIEGFGAAGAWYEGWLLAHPQKNTLYDILFRDLGLDIYRVRNCYDFDVGYINYTKQIVQAAKTRNPSLKILNSAWTPPAYLKSNNDTNSYPLPGTLKKDANDSNNSAPYYYVYKAYAKWWADSLTAYESNSIHSDYICIQNEPDLEITYESCKFLPTETPSYAGYNRAFEAVYQKLNSVMGQNMPKMLPPETMGFGGAGVYIDALIDVNHAYGFAHHLYSDGSYDHPDSFILGMQNFAALYGYKPLFQTEYERLDQPGDNFAAAMNMAIHMYNSLVYEKVCSYFHWCLFWGDNGGLVTLIQPWGPNPAYTINPTYYTFKHYAKFTDAGWSVVDSSADSNNLRITAFKNPAGTELTVVIVNKSDYTEGLMLTMDGFSPLNSQIYRSSGNESWVELGTLYPSQRLICPNKSITTIRLTSGYFDCDAALAAGHRLTADLGGAGDCYVDFADFVVLAGHWLDNNCAVSGNCDGADFEPADGVVDIYDMGDFAAQWMTCNDPENPNCTPN